jgi:FSR family fosmidomycin resistance protein-like MFS transporter
VGGGSIALNVTPRRATAPGFFVAPGALGLFAGTLAAKYGHFTAVVPVVLIAVLVLAAYAIELPRLDYAKATSGKQRHFRLVVCALFLAIAVRSLVGLAVVLPWKSRMALAVVLVVSVFAGKAIGGVLADRFGWTKVAVGSLLVSTPLLVLFPDVASLAIVGMFLFNFTMPITLTALSNRLPGRPGLSFGLTCLALLAGALPVLKGYTVFSGRPAILAASVIAIVAVYVGLTAGGVKRDSPAAG